MSLIKFIKNLFSKPEPKAEFKEDFYLPNREEVKSEAIVFVQKPTVEAKPTMEAKPKPKPKAKVEEVAKPKPKPNKK